MTEAEWVACGDPSLLLKHLKGMASPRQLRLFTVVSARMIQQRAKSRRGRRAVEIAELYADGKASEKEVWMGVARVTRDVQLFPGAREAAHAARLTCLLYNEWAGARGICDHQPHRSATPSLYQVQADLLRDIFGNPFRPVTADPDWLAWNGGVVRTLAESAYDDRVLPSGHLDVTRLALLADMLEDAGCSDVAILEHLRGPGPHVRGCFVVDLLLGKS